ncbi:phospholipid scramblase 2-like [Oppia nitens]|uniref:phospholipid scramblase 2-like n=1 Tax=Oppia nitens TaxID=1686743 RepID=UPI0023DB6233|nr:phospholipid scramblase 2-like [Oppia nitens]
MYQNTGNQMIPYNANPQYNRHPSPTGHPYNAHTYNSQPYNAQPYNNQPYNGQPYNNQPYNAQPYNNQSYNNQSYNNQPYYNQQHVYGSHTPMQPPIAPLMTGQVPPSPMQPMASQQTLVDPKTGQQQIMRQLTPEESQEYRTKNNLPPELPSAPPMPMPVLTTQQRTIPPGLEYLLAVDQLIIKQRVLLFQTMTGILTNNRYEIQNSLGQLVFFAKEINDILITNVCGPNRSFDIEILDNTGRQVMHLSRPYRCDCCCCICCLQLIRVEAPPGCLLGHIRQKWHPIRPVYIVEDDTGRKILRIKGPLCVIQLFFSDIHFNILSRDKDMMIGQINKQWSGMMREYFTNADIYSITFPMDLDVKAKALLVGAAFLIDYMYFERQPQRHHNGGMGMMYGPGVYHGHGCYGMAPGMTFAPHYGSYRSMSSNSMNSDNDW